MEAFVTSGEAKGKDTKMPKYSDRLHAEAYRRYTEAYTHTEMELVAHQDARGNISVLPTPVTYRPEAVCNREELDAIFSSFLLTGTEDIEDLFWEGRNSILTEMRACVGTPGPTKRH